jgi:hypothetical protein
VSLVVHGHLEDFALGEWNEVPILQCSTFQKTGIYTVVTIMNQAATFEVCRAGRCVARTLGRPLEDAP